MGIVGANLRVRRRAKVFRDEIESETKERHLTCPPDVFSPRRLLPQTSSPPDVFSKRLPETKGPSLVNRKHTVANGGLHGYNGFGKMNLAEIIEELPKLTAEERQAIYRQIEELNGEPQFEATEEMRAAIDEATRSLEAGKGIPLEEVWQRFLAKWATK